MNALYPLYFEPVYKDYVWGGTRIARQFHRSTAPARCAESWEIADRPDGMSICQNGPLAGNSLGDLVRDWGTRLVGSAVRPGPFPLLIKIIDAHDTLSVQVHPDESQSNPPTEPKTEMWVILEGSDKTAMVFAGFTKPIDPATFRHAIQAGEADKYMNQWAVHPGDGFFIPGRRLHAIGKGCLILEIQQNSNTTYRVYDWNRKAPDGVSRPLHIESAMQVIRFEDTGDPRCVPIPRSGKGPNNRCSLKTSPWFNVERLQLARECSLHHSGECCSILHVTRGAVSILTDSPLHEVSRSIGDSCLIPASLAQFTLRPEVPDSDIMLIQPGTSAPLPSRA